MNKKPTETTGWQQTRAVLGVIGVLVGLGAATGAAVGVAQMIRNAQVPHTELNPIIMDDISQEIVKANEGDDEHSIELVDATPAVIFLWAIDGELCGQTVAYIQPSTGDVKKTMLGPPFDCTLLEEAPETEPATP